jgi:cytochrome c oxidase subunit 4
MWTADEIILTVTLTGRFLAIGLLLAAVLLTATRQRRRAREALAGRSDALPAGKDTGRPTERWMHLFAARAGAEGGRRNGPGAKYRTPEARRRRTKAYREGLFTFIALAVLTAIEYAISVWLGSLVLLLIAALIKAALIVQFFMHVARLWQEEHEEVTS